LLYGLSAAWALMGFGHSESQQLGRLTTEKFTLLAVGVTVELLDPPLWTSVRPHPLVLLALSALLATSSLTGRTEADHPFFLFLCCLEQTKYYNSLSLAVWAMPVAEPRAFGFPIWWCRFTVLLVGLLIFFFGLWWLCLWYIGTDWYQWGKGFVQITLLRSKMVPTDPCCLALVWLLLLSDGLFVTIVLWYENLLVLLSPLCWFTCEQSLLSWPDLACVSRFVPLASCTSLLVLWFLLV
jgi:hypothetical protein